MTCGGVRGDVESDFTVVWAPLFLSACLSFAASAVSAHSLSWPQNLRNDMSPLLPFPGEYKAWTFGCSAQRERLSKALERLEGNFPLNLIIWGSFLITQVCIQASIHSLDTRAGWAWEALEKSYCRLWSQRLSKISWSLLNWKDSESCNFCEPWIKVLCSKTIECWAN